MQLRTGQRTVLILLPLTILALLFSMVSMLSAMPGTTDYDSIEKKVASLQLGFGEYHIANKLSQDQKKRGQMALEEKSYPGTYTFVDGPLYILVEEDRDVVLAIYQKKEESGKKEMMTMVAGLMARFENPTSEAHDQIIYWAYSEKGKISDTEYKDLKQGDENTILATVKFKSKLTFTEIKSEDAKENTIHCIVSAPRLLERFYQQ